MRDIANPLGSLSHYISRIAPYIGVEVAEERGELSPVYEAARTVARAEKEGRLVLFRVRGHPFPVAANLVPGRPHLYRLLGAGEGRDEEAYAALRRAEEQPGRLAEESFTEYFEEKPGDPGRLLPFLRFYRDDGGSYVTSAVFVACQGGACNASIHRIMMGDGYMAVRVVPRHLYSMLRESPRGLPVAVVEGLDPRLLLASALSPPFGVFELAIGAALVGGELRVCRTPLHGLPVPCGASVVVEAILGPDRAPEGPFTDLLGLYDTVRQEPVLHSLRVYVNRRIEPVTHVILPGGMEHMLMMGFPREASIYAAVSRAVPRVHKVRLTPGGGMWLHAVVSITKSHDGDGKTAGFAALGAHPSLKHVVVVDDDIDPDDPRSVEWAIATRLQADRGIVVIPHARGSTLDPSAREGLTAKLIVDATAPIRERERYRRPEIPTT
jgi:UbiD family decarboxylase